jgi:hypothetical protein
MAGLLGKDAEGEATTGGLFEGGQCALLGQAVDLDRAVTAGAGRDLPPAAFGADGRADNRANVLRDAGEEAEPVALGQR